MYDTCMLVLDVQTWLRGNVPGLELTDGDVNLLRGWIVTSWLKSLIGLIEYSYHKSIPSFPEAQLQRTLGLNMLGLEQF
jgi:hypothetical protein